MKQETERVFSWYANLYNLTEEKRMTLNQIRMFITSDSLKLITKRIRQLSYEKRHKEAKSMKMQLPAFAVSALFPLERKTEQAGEHTGYILVDVDGMKTPVADYLEKCKAFPWLALAYISARGGGVHLIFRVQTDIKQQEETCQMLYDIVETTLGEAVDRVCTDITRTSLVCWDPDAYYNPDAAAFVMETRKQPVTPAGTCPPTSMPTEAERLDLYLDRADMTNTWQKGQRHALLVSLAFCLNRAGFDERLVESECVRRYAQPDFGEKEIAKTIASVYARARAEHGANRREYTPPYAKKSATSANSASNAFHSGKAVSEEEETVEFEEPDQKLPSFDFDLIEQAPAIVRDMIQPGLQGHERNIAIIGGIAMLATVTPHVCGLYHRTTVYPPFFLYVAARAGSGKGILNSMRIALRIWHKLIWDNSRSYVKKYEEEEIAYLYALAQSKKTGKPCLLTQPIPVKQMDLDIMGSISQAKLVELLKANKHYPAVMQESEINVLTDANAQDYGRYVSLFNQIAHQEMVGRGSVANGMNHCDTPLMGVVITGTFGQLVRLIPSTENGLFSRFLAYTVNEPVKWKDLTDEDDNPATGKYYESLGKRIRDIGEFLDASPTFVHYTSSQRKYMNRHFSKMAEKAELFGDDDRKSIVFRLGHAHFCICQTLTAMRKAENGVILENLPVSDIDFKIAMNIINVCHEHILLVSTMLSKEPEYTPPSDPNVCEWLFNALPDTFKTAEANELGKSRNIAERTVSRHLKIWRTNGLITQLSMGRYQKNALS